MFEVGEKVVYPQYGLGIITEVITKQVSDAHITFYRLQFPVKQMEIFVPVQRAKDNGLRRVMNASELDALVTFLSGNQNTVKPQQWHRWRKKTQEQLKTGEPMDMAGIYCYLNNLEKKKGLSFTERKILIQVERMLIAEISAAGDLCEQDAEMMVRGKKLALLEAVG